MSFANKNYSETYWIMINVLIMFFYVLQLLPRERKKHEYLEAVKNRYKHLPEVKRIVRYVKLSC